MGRSMSISAKIKGWAERFREWLLAPVFAEIARLRADIAATRGAGWNGTPVGSHVLDAKADRDPCEFTFRQRQYHITGERHD